jgi:hypothetical protein
MIKKFIGKPAKLPLTYHIPSIGNYSVSVLVRWHRGDQPELQIINNTIAITMIAVPTAEMKVSFFVHPSFQNLFLDDRHS